MTYQSNQQLLHKIQQDAYADKNKKRDIRTARLWNKVADRYAAKPVADHEAYAHKLAITQEYLHPGAVVLEQGCGTGSTALAHARHVKQIIATDLSMRMIEIARDKAAKAGIVNVDFECMSVGAGQIPDSSLDVVMMHSILHLLADWRQSIIQAHTMLKRGGVLVSSTPCLRNDAAFMRVLAPFGRLFGLQLSFFSRNQLEQAMTAAGFEICYAWQPAPKTAVFLIARKPE